VAGIGKPSVLAVPAYEIASSSRAWHRTSAAHWALFLFSRDGKWGTWYGACKNRFICRPPGKLEGERPAGKASEEMALGVPLNVLWLNKLN
jgi:hypothetical protein